MPNQDSVTGNACTSVLYLSPACPAHTYVMTFERKLLLEMIIQSVPQIICGIVPEGR